MPARVESTDPEGVDFGWVMQTTFVLTVTVGAVVVTLLSAGVSLPTWTDKATFAVRVGAVVWIITALAVYAYARTYRYSEDSDSVSTGGSREDPDPEADAHESHSET